MKTKFTPGPWRTSRLISDKPTIHTVQADIHQTLARLGEIDGMDGDVHKANAQLIAAAPEMYSWIEAVIRQLKYEIEAGSRNAESGSGGMVSNLENLLKKARGESET